MGHLGTFGCKFYAKIPNKKQVKSQKTAIVDGKERYFMGYTNESIYQVYFPDSRQIKTIQDLEFDESYDYKEIEKIIVEELIFFFLKLKLLTDSTFKTHVKDKTLFIMSAILLASHSPKDNVDLFSAFFFEKNSLLTTQR